MLVTDVRDDEHYVLLVQEKNGAWNLPGGHIDESIDTEPKACARRKLLEETTLVPSDDLILLACIGSHMIYITTKREFSFGSLPLRKRSREIKAFWWGPMQSALDWCHGKSSLLSSEAQDALILFMSRSSLSVTAGKSKYMSQKQTSQFQGYTYVSMGGNIVWQYETTETHRLGHLRALYVDKFAGGYDPGLRLLMKESKSIERYGKNGHSAANTPFVPLNTVLHVIQTTNTP